MQSLRSEAVQMTTYLLRQEGNDLCTYSIQPLDNFCLKVTTKKKFNYINSQKQLSPMNPKETLVWFFPTIAILCPRDDPKIIKMFAHRSKCT